MFHVVLQINGIHIQPTIGKKVVALREMVTSQLMILTIRRKVLRLEDPFIHRMKTKDSFRRDEGRQGLTFILTNRGQAQKWNISDHRVLK